MLNQNSPQRMSELQLCKDGARIWPNETYFLRRVIKAHLCPNAAVYKMGIF